ncbi:hypothetical protein ACFW2V_12920 [Streptomyces sp. NPDC058947]|uniref:hypothetical protein n=1 Tax=Streptomyces sp. NPDC058947 TaxID=3346675 RepID=UPI003677FFDB
MNTVAIPPDGVPAEFFVDVPVPPGLEYINGVQIRYSFELNVPPQFFPTASLESEDVPLSEHSRDVLSVTRVGQFSKNSSSAARLRIAVNEEGHLDPGNTVTIHAWGVQMLDNADLPGPATISNPTTLEDATEVGIIDVTTWPEWYRLTGRDGS